MELLLNLYVIGVYATLLLFCSMLTNNSKFNDYTAEIIDLGIKGTQFEGTHPYIIMMPFVILCSIFSWIGFVGLITILIDFKEWNKNE